MGEPIISYDNEELENARKLMQENINGLNKEKEEEAKRIQQEQQKPADEVEIAPESKEEEIQHQPDNSEVKYAVTSKGEKIEVDETLNDPFANLDNGEANLINDGQKIEVAVSKNPTPTAENKPDAVEQPKEEVKKEETANNDDDEVVITESPNSGKVENPPSEIVDDSDNKPVDDTQEVTTTKEEVIVNDNKPSSSLVNDNGYEKPFDNSAITVKEEDRKDIFEGIDTNVNLKDIELVDQSNLIEISDSTNEIFEGSVFQVTALKSGYVAYMKALTFKDRDTFIRSDVDRITHNRSMYRMVYDKIDHTSIGSSKISYSNFLKITAWEDLPTLLFGIYRQTFPGESEIMLRCDHCNRESRVKIDPNSFIVTKSEEAMQEIQSLIKDLNQIPNLKPEQLLAKSQVSKIRRIQLPNSKIIVDVTNTSLEKFLNISAYFNRDINESENMPTLVSVCMFIDKIFTPNIKQSRLKGKLVYNKVESLPDIVNILGKLDTEDEFKLKEKVLVRQDKYTVNYQIRNVLCPACKKIISPTDVDMETLLFLSINLEVAYRSLPNKQSE